MQNNFVAIAVKGKEFFYKRSSMIAVPNGRAQDVLDILNARKYQLRDGEIWHAYENDGYTDMEIDKEIKQVRKNGFTIHTNYLRNMQTV